MVDKKEDINTQNNSCFNPCFNGFVENFWA